jgi:glycosyltransferase involved in cell wall biosynthesis
MGLGELEVRGTLVPKRVGETCESGNESCRPARGDVVVKVSVLMISYNQDQFVGQAIDSVLSQRVDFEYELVIGEDCSTDRTREIVASFGAKFPDRIRLLLPKSNLGMQENFKATLAACSGQYVAVLEGDDYWTSPLKLKRQVEFLDAHSDCAICFHSVVRSSPTGGQPESILPDSRYKQDRYTTRDLLVENFIPTCSVMFRRGLFGELPDWMGTLGFSDWPIHILNSECGSIGYIKQTMGVYRVHSEGAWSGRISGQRRSDMVRFYEVIDAHLKFKYHRVIKQQASAHLFELAARKLRDIPNRKRYFLQSVFMHPYITATHQLDLFGIGFFPGIRHSIAKLAKLCLRAAPGRSPGIGKEQGTLSKGL